MGQETKTRLVRGWVKWAYWMPMETTIDSREISMRTTRIRPAGSIGFACACMSALCVGILIAGEVQDSQVKLKASASAIDKDGQQTVTIKMAINDGWYAYANPVKNEDLESTQTVVKIVGKQNLSDVAIVYPKGHMKTLGKDSYYTYEGTVEIVAKVKRAPGDTSPLDVTVKYQTCNAAKGFCLRPESVTLQVK
jgi:DsbC/DsbD-like thiol-disulfide interchange protein